MKAYNSRKLSKEKRRFRKGSLRVSFTCHRKNCNSVFTKIFGEPHISIKIKDGELLSRILIK